MLKKSLEVLKANGDPSQLPFWNAVVETMNEGLVVVDRQRRILYLNKKAEEITGVQFSDARGESCKDAIKCPQCACTCRLFEEGEFDNVEVRLFNQNDGEERFILKNARILADDDGSIIGGVETFADITKQVTARRRERQRADQVFLEKERSQALIDSLSEGVFALGPEFEIREYSRRMSELTGYQPDEAIGCNLFSVLGLEELPIATGGIKQLPVAPQRVEIRCQDGSFLAAELLFRPLQYGDGEVIGVIRSLKGHCGNGDGPLEDCARHGIITQSPLMRPIFSVIENAAASDVSVLIEGDSGTGKELVARAIHRLSERREKPFYAVNCATFTGSLLLSEFFGHERGAFTGAFASKKGKFELAGEGTLFLDEIGEIPTEHQGLLLRILEERTFERVGGHQQVPMQARIISATNKNLRQSMTNGDFREDLFYRLNVVPVRLPPLRERSEDIPLLTQHFLDRSARRTGRPLQTVTNEVMDAFLTYHWPGNVRELKNLVEYLGFLSHRAITVDELPREFLHRLHSEAQTMSDLSLAGAGDNERDRIVAALKRFQYHKGKAAEILGMNRSTLWRKMQRYGI